jgi:hypothetical protein
MFVCDRGVVVDFNKSIPEVFTTWLPR